MANRYWVGGTNTWNATAGTKWALTSGGAGGQAVPTSSDDVFFDANSGTVTVTSSAGANTCHSFSYVGFTGSFSSTGNATLTIFGSLTLGTGGLSAGWTSISMGSTSTGNTITTNGSSTAVDSIFFGGVGGVWTLQDNWTETINSIFAFTNGTFDANSHDMSFGAYYITGSSARTLTMGSGTWTVKNGDGFGKFWDATTTTNLTFNPNTSTIKYISTSAVTFTGGGLTYNNIWFSKGTSTTSITVSGSNTFNNFKDDGTGTHSILFTTGTTQTFTTFTVSGIPSHLISINSTTTGTHALVKTGGGVINSDYLNIQHSVATPSSTWYAGTHSTNNQAVATAGSGWTFTAPSSLPTVTTQAVTSIAATTAIGNGNITVAGSPAPDERGIVYDTSSHGDPGNTAPGSSLYSGLSNSMGTFGTGAFTNSLTGLISRTTYYVRAYAHNSLGYTYGSEISFTTIGFTNPANIYASDNTYATLAAVNGDLIVELSKDGGANYGSALTKTFTGSDTLQTYGTGSSELWGYSWTRADMVNANFRVRLSQGNISQVYKTFGFATGSDTLTGIEVAVEGHFLSSTLSLDLLEVKIYYGTSVLPVQAGSQAYASNGRKNGEGAGSGTGVLVFYDGAGHWIACDSGTTVAA